MANWSVRHCELSFFKISLEMTEVWLFPRNTHTMSSQYIEKQLFLRHSRYYSSFSCQSISIRIKNRLSACHFQWDLALTELIPQHRALIRLINFLFLISRNFTYIVHRIPVFSCLSCELTLCFIFIHCIIWYRMSYARYLVYIWYDTIIV